MSDGVTLALRLGVLALLYLFLATIARIAWRDFASAAPRQRGSIGRAALVVLEGASGGPHVGDRIAIEGGASLGRDSDNAVVIDDRTVSSRHAALLFDAGRWWVEDGGSTNGTYINGARVTDSASIKDGDVLQVGRVIFRLSA
jgi:pSer/pThr/pTyr-binding forkhead associated (FHA) protein